jgi:GNAT superfamily N-acetyltransferase
VFHYLINQHGHKALRYNPCSAHTVFGRTGTRPYATIHARSTPYSAERAQGPTLQSMLGPHCIRQNGHKALYYGPAHDPRLHMPVSAQFFLVPEHAAETTVTNIADIVIRRLTTDDVNAFVALRRDSLRESPLAFSASIDEDVGCNPELMCERLAASSKSLVLGAFGPELVGTVGLYREFKRKTGHKAHIWGMYVIPSHQGHGIGRRLFAAVIQAARDVAGLRQLQLSVSESATEALQLYESCGFRTWGREPRGLCHEGRCVTVQHLALELE